MAAPAFYDRVLETSTTTGTGTYTLAGAVNGYQSWAAVGNTNIAYYHAYEVDANGNANGGWEVGSGAYTASGTTLSRLAILASSNAGSAVNWSAGTRRIGLGIPAYVANYLYPTTPGGRLTLTTALPVTTADVTGATTVYYTPYLNDRIQLWDFTAWVAVAFTEVSLALGTVTSGLPYDVFGYLNGTALNIEKLAWTNGTTRATTVTLQDGRYCKSTDKSRLYLGTFYTTATTTTEDSAAKRFLWNMYNRVTRFLQATDTTDTWTYGTASWRYANNSSANRVQFVTGIAEDSVSATSQVQGDGTTSTALTTGVGVDSNTSNGAQVTTEMAGANLMASRCTGIAQYRGVPSGVGFHYLAWVEYARTGTTTVYGDGGAANGAIQSGMVAEMRA